MANILSSRVNDHKIVVEIEANKEEILGLNGQVNGIRLFAELNNSVRSGIAARGKGAATKYFLIPKELRDKLPMSKVIRCQRIRHDSKQWYVFEV